MFKLCHTLLLLSVCSAWRCLVMLRKITHSQIPLSFSPYMGLLHNTSASSSQHELLVDIVHDSGRFGVAHVRFSSALGSSALGRHAWMLRRGGRGNEEWERRPVMLYGSRPPLLRFAGWYA
jgi:hypothetical protein